MKTLVPASTIQYCTLKHKCYMYVMPRTYNKFGKQPSVISRMHNTIKIESTWLYATLLKFVCFKRCCGYSEMCT